MGRRFLLSSDSTTLTITNTVESDAGIYEVKHMGLVISQRQEKCESRVLDALQNYPILSGIRFTVINTLSGNLLMWLANQCTVIYFRRCAASSVRCTCGAIEYWRPNVHPVIMDTFAWPRVYVVLHTELLCYLCAILQWTGGSTQWRTSVICPAVWSQ